MEAVQKSCLILVDNHQSVMLRPNGLVFEYTDMEIGIKRKYYFFTCYCTGKVQLKRLWLDCGEMQECLKGWFCSVYWWKDEGERRQLHIRINVESTTLLWYLQSANKALTKAQWLDMNAWYIQTKNRIHSFNSRRSCNNLIQVVKNSINDNLKIKSRCFS